MDLSTFAHGFALRAQAEAQEKLNAHMEQTKSPLRGVIEGTSPLPMVFPSIKEVETLYLYFCLLHQSTLILMSRQLDEGFKEEYSRVIMLASCVQMGMNRLYPDSGLVGEVTEIYTGRRSTEVVMPPAAYQDLGTIWKELSELSRQHDIYVPDDELRELLLPAPRADFDPVRPPLEDLCPVPIRDDVRPLMEREPHSAAWLSGLTLNHLLSLEHLNYADVIGLLEATGSLRATGLLSYEDKQRVNQLLKRVLEVTGPVRTPGLKPNQTIRTEHHEQVLQKVLWQLKESTLNERAQGSIHDHMRRLVLWSAFDQLDEFVETHHLLNGLLTQLTGLEATLLFRRAPGMPLSTETELGAQISGIDPLLGWKDVVYGEDHTLTLTLNMLKSMCVAVRINPKLPDEMLDEFCAIAGELTLELTAQLRAIGIRLPSAELFKMLSPSGTLSRLSPRWSETKNYALWVHRYSNWFEQLAELESQSTADLTAQAPAESEPCSSDQPAKEPSPEPCWPAHVQQVRELLRGGHVILLGGEVLPTHHQNIERALGIKLEWISSDRYDNGMQAAVRLQSDTRLVILAIRWMAHAHNTLRDAAKEQGIPCVMHPAGLNPVSLAHHILIQAGHRLT